MNNDFNEKLATPLKELDGLAKFIVSTSDRSYIALDNYRGEKFEMREVVSMRTHTTTYLDEETLVNVTGYVEI
jgi:hypothetical protein